MSTQIISASGTQFGLIVNSDGTLSVASSTLPPTTVNSNPLYQFKYLVSGTAAGVTGSAIGSIIQFLGTGSYVQTLTYVKDKITNVGSWS